MSKTVENNRPVTFCISEKQKAKLVRLAKKAKLTQSDYIRKLITEAK